LSLLARLVAAVLVVLVSALPATAVQPRGSAAWTTNGWTNFTGKLYAGPATIYAVTGDVAAGIRVRVDRCSQRWCYVHSGHDQGWLSIDNVSFGQHPDGWFAGPKFPTKSGAGTVCFFSGRNYTGSEFCADSGHVYKDLVLIGYDNAFGSVKIGGAANALVCRDRNFRSYCKVIDVDTRNLEGLLNHAISSIRVY
jgi:uncharacterized protein YraI